MRLNLDNKTYYHSKTSTFLKEKTKQIDSIFAFTHRLQIEFFFAFTPRLQIESFLLSTLDFR